MSEEILGSRRQEDAGIYKKMRERQETARDGNRQEETVLLFISIFKCWPINSPTS